MLTPPIIVPSDPIQKNTLSKVAFWFALIPHVLWIGAGILVFMAIRFGAYLPRDVIIPAVLPIAVFSLCGGPIICVIITTIIECSALVITIVSIRRRKLSAVSPQDRRRMYKTLILVIVYFIIFTYTISYVTINNGKDAMVNDKGNFRILMEDCNSYANNHHGHFPPALVYIAFRRDRYYSNLSMRLNSLPKDYGLPEYIDETDCAKYAKQVDASSDYRYLGADLIADAKLDGCSNSIIVFYTKSSYFFRRVVAFADGHTEIISSGKLPEIFKQSNDSRASIGIPGPPLTIDGPSPTRALP